MSDAVRLTDKSRQLFYGSDDPAENPVRFRKCPGCGGVIDILNAAEGIWWYPGRDEFAHKVCVPEGES